MKDCEGFLGIILGHNFQPIITKGEPAIKIKIEDGSMEELLPLLEASRPETYHGVFCRRCGLRHE